ncbi:MFS transporter [Streptomyces parvulus]|uniref:MFS transporter n=1 Tax=Streptomyces parvulus TaxID=146923 RepID=UPI0036E02D37
MTAAPSATRAPRERLGRAPRTVVGLTFCAWLLSYGDRQLVSLALPLIGTDLGIDNTGRGLLLSAFFLAYAATQIPGGMLADRFGAKPVAVAGIVGWSLFTVLTGVVSGMAALLVVRFLFGVGEGVFPAASMKAIAEQTTPGQRMTANGWVLSSNALGTLFAATAGAALLSAIGWRHTFVVFGVLGFAVAAVVGWKLPRPRPVERVAEARTGDPEERAGSLRDLLRSWTMWRFSLMYFGIGTVTWGVSSWVPSYLYDVHGIDLSRASVLLAAPILAAAVATVLGGRIADAVQGRHRIVIVPSMAVTAVSLVVITQVTGLAVFVIAVSVALFAASLATASVFAVPSKSLPTHLLGSGSAIVLVGSQVAGIVAPTVMGRLVDTVSYAGAFGYLVCGAALTGLVSLLTPQTTPAFLNTLTLRPRPAARPEGDPA